QSGEFYFATSGDFYSAVDTGQTLTEAGEALLAKVETMDQLAADISDQGGRSSALSGTLRISVSEGFGVWFLAPHLPGFSAAHPDLTVDLVASSGFLSPSKREADIAVLLSRPKAGPVISRKLSDYHLKLYASLDYLQSHGAPLNKEDLASSHRLVGYIPDLLYAPELAYLDEINPGNRLGLRSSSINAQHRQIANGGGIGVLPCFIGDLDPNLNRVLDDITIVRSFWLVTHKDNHNTARIRRGREWLIDLAQSGRAGLMPAD
ncbi:LysR substrate-binding domain-containing protein, partial [Novosphingobium sp. AAP93]|uniref:LysR substrate-binding domain-containing protein n=1 Tax=Novosphingobium sp. AAP93 TaxID=1523427 RepID=UPI0006B908A9